MNSFLTDRRYTTGYTTSYGFYIAIFAGKRAELKGLSHYIWVVGRVSRECFFDTEKPDAIIKIIYTRMVIDTIVHDSIKDVEAYFSGRMPHTVRDSIWAWSRGLGMTQKSIEVWQSRDKQSVPVPPDTRCI